MRISLLLWSVLALLAPKSLSAKTIFVNQNATGSNNGTSWTNAFVFIDDALSNWQTDDSIWVAKGQYSPKDSNVSTSYRLPSGCVLIGGFNGTEKWLTQRNIILNRTTISGDINDKNYPNDNVRTLILADKTQRGTRIDGFTIKDGYNYFIAGGITMGGGAIRIIDAYLEIANCEFLNNYAYMRGGAIYQQTSSKQVSVSHCLFENNSTGIDRNSLGGAVFANSANFFFQDCEFNLNTSQSGGAIALYEASITADRCIFSGNEARIRDGAAIYDGSDSQFKIYNSLFVGNVADDNCPAIYSSAVFNTQFNEIINCTFAHNIAKPASGTYTVRSNEDTKVYNCIFYGNQATLDLFNLSPTFVPDVQNCLFEDGITIGRNNLKADPIFRNPATLSDVPFHHEDYNYRFTKQSLCFEAGNSNLLNTRYKTGLDGNERPIYQEADLGAYEADFDLIFLDLVVNPSNADTFNQGGYYTRDTTITLYADSSECFSFSTYTSGRRILSDNSRMKITLTSDTVIQATFTSKNFVISVESADETMGSVTGGGRLDCGLVNEITVEATSKKCYKFVNWTENGIEVSRNATYTFTNKGNRSLKANFEQKIFDINSSVYPQGTGTVSGRTKAPCGTEVTLTANPANGWKFLEWQQNGQFVSDDPNIKFTINQNWFITAHFEENVSIQEPSAYGIQIFPNPANKLINLDFGDYAGKTMVLIVDVSGKEVFRESILESKTQLNVESLSSGLYTLIITSKDFTVGHRIAINCTN
ncbi:MAG: T9SS type A sorting domain-containing protein [Bacteroidia bacterium]